MPLASGVDLDQIAAQTPGLVGTDLRNLVNEAALAAACKDLIDDEVKRIAEECATSAGDLLERHRDKLDALVVALLVHDSLNEREILVVPRLGGAEATNGALPDGARGLVSSRPGP